MSSAHHTTDSSHSQSSSSENNDAHSLLFKLYSLILSNSLVKMGIKQLADMSQPIVGKLEDNILTVTDNLNKRFTHQNVYNHLAKQWLERNFPFNGTVVPYEMYARRLDRQQRDGYEKIIKDYYDTASKRWKSVDHSDSEEVKNAILDITSKVVNKANRFEDENLATALCNMLRLLIERRREFVSPESYLNLVKMALGDDFYLRNQQAMKTACDEYYSFARRFILVDFPLANANGVIKTVLNFIQDNIYICSDTALNCAESKLDFVLNLVGEKPHMSKEDHSLVEKFQRVTKKTFMLSFLPLTMSCSYLKDTKGFVIADQYLHITARADNAIALLSWGHKTFNDALGATCNAIQVTKDTTKSVITVVMHGLNPQVVKKNFSKLYNELRILKECVVLLKDDTVKIIYDKKTRGELTEDAKKELVRFYHEVKSLERQRISDITLEYYIQILKKAKSTYRTAKKLTNSNAEELEKVKANLKQEQDESLDDEAVSGNEMKNSLNVEATD